MKIYVPPQTIRDIDSINRLYLVDILKPIINLKNLNKYNMKNIDLDIVQNDRDSDCFILPFSWKYYYNYGKLKEAITFIKQAETIDKKVIIWVTGDYFIFMPKFQNLIILYQSPYKFLFNSSMVALPVIINDPINKIEFYKQNYCKKPRIGFCGQADLNIMISLLRIIRNIIFFLKIKLYHQNIHPGYIIPGSMIRKNIINILQKKVSLNTNFILRNRYKSGNLSDKKYQQKMKLEFYNNILSTDYTLCVRGTGNFSARLYETLALGRIPIFVNSNCTLPFDDLIDWKKHVVWIEQNQISSIVSIILNFHNNLTEGSFYKLQTENRKLWEKYFKFSDYIHQLIPYINNKLDQ